VAKGEGEGMARLTGPDGSRAGPAAGLRERNAAQLTWLLFAY
jgi:hypothetical protein